MPITPAQARAFRDMQLRLKRAEYALEHAADEDTSAINEYLDARDARQEAERAANVASGRRSA